MQLEEKLKTAEIANYDKQLSSKVYLKKKSGLTHVIYWPNTFQNITRWTIRTHILFSREFIEEEAMDIRKGKREDIFALCTKWNDSEYLV